MPAPTPTSPPVVLRTLEERDWPQVHDLVVDVARQGRTYALEVPADVAATRATWVGELLVVAVDGETVLGAAKAGPNRPGPGAHVGTASFVVGPQARGRGVGRALGEHVVAWHRARGFRAIQFNAVVSTNLAAVRLWRSLGFEVVGTVPGAFALPGEEGYADLLVMHLDLTGATPDHGARPEVLDAAAEAFLQWGWSGTTFERVARLAGVPELDLARRFVSRSDLLISVMRQRMAGAGDMHDAFVAFGVDPDAEPAERREQVARFTASMIRPIAGLVRVLWQAADEDPVAEALRRGAELRRLRLSRAMVEVVATGATTAPDAVGAVQTLTTAENYLCLAGLGWDEERYVRWLAAALDHAVNGRVEPGPA